MQVLSIITVVLVVAGCTVAIVWNLVSIIKTLVQRHKDRKQNQNNEDEKGKKE